MRRDVHRHRAERDLDEPATPAGSHHRQAGPGRRLDQRGPCVGFDQRGRDLEIGMGAGELRFDAVEHVLSGYPDSVGEFRTMVVIGMADDRHHVGGEHPEVAPLAPSLVRRPAGGRHGRHRAIDAHHHDRCHVVLTPTPRPVRDDPWSPPRPAVIVRWCRSPDQSPKARWSLQSLRHTPWDLPAAHCGATPRVVLAGVITVGWVAPSAADSTGPVLPRPESHIRRWAPTMPGRRHNPTEYSTTLRTLWSRTGVVMPGMGVVMRGMVVLMPGMVVVMRGTAQRLTGPASGCCRPHPTCPDS